MNAITEKKPPTTTATATNKKATADDVTTAAQDTTNTPVNELQAAIEKLDAEMKEKLTNVIDQLVPGNSASLNTSVVKEISKIETRKNRLITARLELLLRKGNPEAKEIVERLLAIEV